MRPILITLLIACCGAFAQSRGGNTAGVHAGAGFAGGVHPGGGFAGRPPSAGHGFVAGHGSVSGQPWAARPHNGRTVIVPYPVFYGGYYLPPPGYGYGYDPLGNGYADSGQGYYGDPGYAYGAGYAAPPQSPAAMVNPGFRPDAVNPVIHDYSNTPLPEPTFKKYGSPSQPSDNQTAAAEQQPTIYLIAMKDHTIFPTVAYWVEGDTLNYVTTEGSHNRATLDLVDRDFSMQLNQERQVDFHLPAQK